MQINIIFPENQVPVRGRLKNLLRFGAVSSDEKLQVVFSRFTMDITTHPPAAGSGSVWWSWALLLEKLEPVRERDGPWRYTGSAEVMYCTDRYNAVGTWSAFFNAAVKFIVCEVKCVILCNIDKIMKTPLFDLHMWCTWIPLENHWIYTINSFNINKKCISNS